MHTRVAVVICLPTCYVFAALAMLIRVIGSDRAVKAIWHRKVRLKPVRLYNVTIVIIFGGLSSFQNCPNNLGVVRIGIAIVVCLSVCLRFGAPAMLKSRNITACRSSAYVTEHWSVSGTIFRRALAGAVQ